MRVFGIRLSVLGRFYRWRLREHGIQELLAAAGIAVGVALVYGVLVANTSLIGSARQLVHGIVGSARLQLAAQAPGGYDQAIADRASTLPGVARSAPAVRATVAVLGPNGKRRAIHLFGVTPDLAQLGGRNTKDFGPGGLRLSNGITLPTGIAAAIGARAGKPVRLLANGKVHSVLVGSVLGSDVIGSSSQTPIGIALLPVAQRLLGMPGRVSQLLIEPKPGADAALARELRRLSGGRLYVGPADAEMRQIQLTAKPNDQSTLLFATIGAIVGILLALNAMLMTVPERRRFVAELRTQGFDPAQVLLILAFEAFVLGLAASVAGLAFGDLLSRTLFDRVPAYLAFAFPIGTQRIIDTSTLLLAGVGGVLATVLASLPPALDLRPGRPIDGIYRDAEDGEAGQSVGPRLTQALVFAGLAVIVASTVLVALAPGLTIVVAVTLAVATLCLIPAAFAAVVPPLERVARRMRGSMLAVAVMELRATTTRSIALAAVGAVAVYGSVAIEGAHHDLVGGLDRSFGQFLSTADLWITTGGDDLTTNSFDATGLSERLRRVSGVTMVRPYYGGLLDVGDRRLWIIGRGSSDPAMIPASQLVSGDLATASARLRRGGWAAVSDVFAVGRHLTVRSSFTLPTPSGTTTLRVAAITTNLGWPPGGVILNARDYRRAWRTSDPAALQIDLRPGVSPAAAKRALTYALGPASALRVQTRKERRAQYASLSRQGLASLTQISDLLLIAAALAVASALSAAIWQRRPRLAALKIQGFDHRQLWRALLLESAIVLTVGCVVGAVLGLYGHALASRYLQSATGFPAPFSIAAWPLLLTLVLVISIALAVIAVPGWAATRVSPRASFQTE